VSEPGDKGGAKAREGSWTEPYLTREEYFAERELLIDARQRSYQRAEQMVTGGAAGALILSITFLEKIAPGPLVREPEWLIAGWILLLVTLALGLLAQYASARSFGCEMKCLEARIHEEEVPKNRWAVCNHACGIVSALLFVTGVGLLATFAYLNAPFQPRG
jgi:hypothetical protein